MNERLKELAKQAVVVKMRKQHVNGGLPPRAYESPEFSKEKFAELIVRECANWINENLGLVDEEAKADLLKHFGVKE